MPAAGLVDLAVLGPAAAAGLVAVVGLVAASAPLTDAVAAGLAEAGLLLGAVVVLLRPVVRDRYNYNIFSESQS